MNEFLSRLCAFLKDFPEQQVSIPFGYGELFVMYRGPESDAESNDSPQTWGLTEPESEGLRLPNCHHRPAPTPASATVWLTAKELGARYGITAQKVGRLGTKGKIQRRKDAPSGDYRFLDPGTNPAEL